MNHKEFISKENIELNKNYIEHPTKAVEDKRFRHMMALTLNSSLHYKNGVIRCITNRKGNVDISGYVDRSKLYTVSGKTLENFSVEDELKIANEKRIVEKLSKDNLDFLGLEDPDIFVDEKTGLTHLYFTMPFIAKNKMKGHSRIHLGHAVGKDMNTLEMTMPVLEADETHSAKEVSIAPESSKGVRYNLFESSHIENDVHYSTVRVAIAEDMDKPWEYGQTVFNPKEQNIPWAGGHASPGPLFSKDFIDVGEGRLLGIMNGREANKKIDGKTHYGTFSIGLFIYDYENGKIDWVSKEPFIQDSEAKTITFASQFVETDKGEGILYAHVDDSFVRAYTLKASSIECLLPSK